MRIWTGFLLHCTGPLFMSCHERSQMTVYVWMQTINEGETSLRLLIPTDCVLHTIWYDLVIFWFSSNTFKLLAVKADLITGILEYGYYMYLKRTVQITLYVCYITRTFIRFLYVCTFLPKGFPFMLFLYTFILSALYWLRTHCTAIVGGSLLEVRFRISLKKGDL